MSDEIDNNYNRMFEHETIYDFIRNKDNYIKELIPELYLFLAENRVTYHVFEKIDNEKFIELALAYASKKES